MYMQGQEKKTLGSIRNLIKKLWEKYPNHVKC